MTCVLRYLDDAELGVLDAQRANVGVDGGRLGLRAARLGLGANHLGRVLVVRVVRHRRVQHVRVVRLQANVQKAEHGEHLVDHLLALLVEQVLGDEAVLHALQRLSEGGDNTREIHVRAEMSVRNTNADEDRKPEQQSAHAATSKSVSCGLKFCCKCCVPP
jgi:hypothetical protein